MANRITPQTKAQGFATITNVVKKERNIPNSKIMLNSLPHAFIIGVFQWTAKMQAATIVIRIPAQATQMGPRKW